MPVHPSAVVEPGAEIDPTAEIGPYCVIGPSVRIGPGTRLLSGVTVMGRTSVGARNTLHPYSVIGGDPQDFKFRGEDSELVIGDDNVIRENVTINKGTEVAGNVTRIGNRNFIMGNCHVAHDSVIEDGCLLANGSLLAGHVKVESFAIISGWVGIHHFVTIGRHAMIGGASRINQDCPPYMITQGMEAEVKSVNVIGLRRRGFKPEAINALRDAHRLIWRSSLPKPDALSQLENRNGMVPEVRYLIDFLRATDRGSLGRAREALRQPPQESEGDTPE